MIKHYYRALRRELNIMDNKLEKLLKESQADKICDYEIARGVELYLTIINGYGLVFMKSHNPFGARCYLLDDSLAKVLGFGSIDRLKQVLPIRKSNKFISVNNLRRAINRYGERAIGIKPMVWRRGRGKRSPPKKKA